MRDWEWWAPPVILVALGVAPLGVLVWMILTSNDRMASRPLPSGPRPREAFEVCAVECHDAEIGMRLARVDLRHHVSGGGFTCVCERSER